MEDIMVSEATNTNSTKIYRLIEERVGNEIMSYSIVEVIKYSGGFEDVLSIGKQLHVEDGNNIESALCRFDEFLHEIGWL